jgi:hypothetical protein
VPLDVAIGTFRLREAAGHPDQFEVGLRVQAPQEGRTGISRRSDNHYPHDLRVPERPPPNRPASAPGITSVARPASKVAGWFGGPPGGKSAIMPTSRPDSTAPSSGLEPLGDPDDDGGDFAEEHDQFVVEGADEPEGGEEESPDRYAGGLDREGPP